MEFPAADVTHTFSWTQLGMHRPELGKLEEDRAGEGRGGKKESLEAPSFMNLRKSWSFHTEMFLVKNHSSDLSAIGQ